MSEHTEQRALFEWAALAKAARPELALLFAIPNGGYRHKRTAGRLKAEGVRRGMLDICLPVARSGKHGLFIEMKVGRSRATPDQIGWIAALQEQGYAALICRGWESARAVIEDYLDGGMK